MLAGAVATPCGPRNNLLAELARRSCIVVLVDGSTDDSASRRRLLAVVLGCSRCILHREVVPPQVSIMTIWFVSPQQLQSGRPQMTWTMLTSWALTSTTQVIASEILFPLHYTRHLLLSTWTLLLISAGSVARLFSSPLLFLVPPLIWCVSARSANLEAWVLYSRLASLCYVCV